MARCRHCGSGRLRMVLSLGTTPLANSNVSEERLSEPEPVFPLELLVCEDCMLAQLDEYEAPDHIFTDYAYFSSWSTTWLEHARAYVEQVSERFALGAASMVVEVASNDGYLLQYFVERGVPVLGVEPAANVAAEAVAKGIPTQVAFLTQASAKRLVAEGYQADLVVGNNVLAHVPALNDFVAALRILLKPAGVITMEFPHLYRLVEETQFDTIYHEHFSYFSLFVVIAVFARHGLAVFDVDRLTTHGGSLRIYACHADKAPYAVSERVGALESLERGAGMATMEYYERFAEEVARVKREVVEFLRSAKREGKRVAGYGAPAKGNTLLNFCGIGRDLVGYTVDRNPHKQGLYTPGMRIPIRDPKVVEEDKPDYLWILPWNIKDEVMEQMAGIRGWGGRFVVAIPRLHIYD
ncbi:MAG: methyltransferase domain-containing protein [Candidatus Hydrogenedentes bacterium]|nr:methyltransferase domain-containing protein [Candidatus Hydrogenedentota bacterium]